MTNDPLLAGRIRATEKRLKLQLRRSRARSEFVSRAKVTAVKRAFCKIVSQMVLDAGPALSNEIFAAAQREGGQAAVAELLRAKFEELESSVADLTAAAIEELNAD